MECWIKVSNPLERYMADYKRIFDAWEDGGVRGWHIMVFGVSSDTAQVQSLVNAYPQVHGVIIDGPGEQHYELAWHHGGEILQLRDRDRQRFSSLGFDVDRLECGIAHMRNRCHNLSPDMVRYHAAGGMLAGLILFDINEDTLYWLRARQEAALRSWQQARAELDKVDRHVELGGILQASKDAGMKRFLFHPDPDPGASEWSVITRMCGNPWNQSRDGYWPSDSAKPHEYLRDPSD